VTPIQLLGAFVVSSSLLFDFQNGIAKWLDNRWIKRNAAHTDSKDRTFIERLAFQG